jgi:hypothetical protein
MARSLTQGQMDAAKLILSTSARVVGVQGYAGMLATVKEIADILGVSIKGMAPTAGSEQIRKRAKKSTCIIWYKII